MPEYKVNPRDVFVIRRVGGGGRAPRPPEPGLAGWLRRFRFRLALAVIIVEGVLAWHYGISPYLLIAIAIACVALYILVRRRLRSPVVRNAALILALSQAVLAVVPLFVTAFAIAIVAAVVAVIFVMITLGERSRRAS